MSLPNELYRDATKLNYEEYRAYLNEIDAMDWENYDYKTWPCADLSFPDLDEDKKVRYDFWPFKRDLNQPHYVCLNKQFRKSILRIGYINRFKLPEKLTKNDIIKVLSILREIESLKETNPLEFKDKLNEYDFKDEEHFSWGLAMIDNEEQKAYSDNDDVLKGKQTELAAQIDNQIEEAKTSGLLDPISGIDMDTWAAANAKIASGMDLEEVLKIVGTEKPIWDEVSAEWMARMSQDTTFAISKVYGDAFSNSNIGKFAIDASEEEANISSSGSLNKVMEDFDLYIKIMCHQNMGAAQGKDANSILKEYGLSVNDWSALGVHWGTQTATDTRLAVKMGELMEKYTADFATAGAGDDIDF